MKTNLYFFKLLFLGGNSQNFKNGLIQLMRQTFIASGLLLLSVVVSSGQTYTYSTPGTWYWTCPPNTDSAIVECWGAGGAGGGANLGVNDTAGGGGGGGAWVKAT